MAKFFIDRPIFAWVIALFILVMGGVALTQLPIAQYPKVAPPSIGSARRPGNRSSFITARCTSPETITGTASHSSCSSNVIAPSPWPRP